MDINLLLLLIKKYFHPREAVLSIRLCKKVYEKLTVKDKEEITTRYLVAQNNKKNEKLGKRIAETYL